MIHKGSMKKLPKPRYKQGYTEPELRRICKHLLISIESFWEAFGINTCGLSKSGKTTYYYVCDVEKALYKLGSKLGKDHLWD